MLIIDKNTNMYDLLQNTKDNMLKEKYDLWFYVIGKPHKKRVNGFYPERMQGIVISIEEPEYISSDSYNCEVTIKREDGSFYKYRDFI
jgi:hypothetical protein